MVWRWTRRCSFGGGSKTRRYTSRTLNSRLFARTASKQGNPGTAQTHDNWQSVTVSQTSQPTTD
jgi:hypothetical protein